MKPKDATAQRAALIERIQTEGAQAAYDAALEVLRDKKAPAPAKATCLTALFRAGGYFANPEGGSPKEPHEMTAYELAAAIEELEGMAKAAQRHDADADDAEVFG